jgi:hypothetical protein
MSNTEAFSGAGGSPPGISCTGLCYACESSYDGALNAGVEVNFGSSTSDWSCSDACPGATGTPSTPTVASGWTLGDGAITTTASMTVPYGGAPASSSYCYGCSSGALETSSGDFGACGPSECVGSTPGDGTHTSSSSCYKCTVDGTWGGTTNGTVTTTTGTGSCTVTGGCPAVSAGCLAIPNDWTVTSVTTTGAVSIGVCSGCCPTPHPGYTAPVLDTVMNGTHMTPTCDTCSTTAPAQTLDTSITTNGYQCVFDCPK